MDEVRLQEEPTPEDIAEAERRNATILESITTEGLKPQTHISGANTAAALENYGKEPSIDAFVLPGYNDFDLSKEEDTFRVKFNTLDLASPNIPRGMPSPSNPMYKGSLEEMKQLSRQFLLNNILHYGANKSTFGIVEERREERNPQTASRPFNERLSRWNNCVVVVMPLDAVKRQEGRWIMDSLEYPLQGPITPDKFSAILVPENITLKSEKAITVGYAQKSLALLQTEEVLGRPTPVEHTFEVEVPDYEKALSNPESFDPNKSYALHVVRLWTPYDIQRERTSSN